MAVMRARGDSGLLRSASSYVLGRGFSLLAAAIAGIAVARALGPADLGLLGYASAVFAIAVPISLLGLRHILVREFSTSDDHTALLTSALALQIPLSLLTSAVAFLIVAGSRSWETDATLVALALLPMPLLATRDTLEALHESLNHVRVVVLASAVAAAVASVLKITLAIGGAPVWVFAATVSLEALLHLVGLAIGARVRGRQIVPTQRTIRNADLTRRLVAESWPLLVSGLAVLLYMKADLFMLGLLSSDTETGLYAAASRISEVWFFIPVAAAAAIRPRLARLHESGSELEYHRLTQQFLSGSLMVSTALMILTIVAAGGLVTLLYGAEFAGAAPVLRIHVIATPFVFLGIAAGQWFIDRGMTRFLMWKAVAGAILNIGLNVVLIPEFGATGAAIATVAAYSLSGVLYNLAAKQGREVFRMQVRALALRKS